MVFSFLYLAFRALLGALVRSRRGLDLKDVELLVVRHELEVLRRQVVPPTVSPFSSPTVTDAAAMLVCVFASASLQASAVSAVA